MAVEIDIKARLKVRISSDSNVIEQFNASLAKAMIWWTTKGSSTRGTMRDIANRMIEFHGCSRYPW